MVVVNFLIRVVRRILGKVQQLRTLLKDPGGTNWGNAEKELVATHEDGIVDGFTSSEVKQRLRFLYRKR